MSDILKMILISVLKEAGATPCQETGFIRVDRDGAAVGTVAVVTEDGVEYVVIVAGTDRRRMPACHPHLLTTLSGLFSVEPPWDPER